MATEFSIIGQTSSISSTSGSGSTSASGVSTSIGGSANGGATSLPIQSTRQYITVTQSPLIQKRTSNAKQEASDVKVSDHNWPTEIRRPLSIGHLSYFLSCSIVGAVEWSGPWRSISIMLFIDGRGYGRMIKIPDNCNQQSIVSRAIVWDLFFNVL